MSKERRLERRVPIEMWVEEERGEDCYYQRSTNLSVGGIYLDGTIPHPKGTFVRIKFTLPGEQEPLAFQGEIVGQPDASRLGMHVRFVDLDTNPGAARLREFLSRAGGQDGDQD